MDGSSSTYSLSGSGGIINGPFAVVENLERVLKTYEKSVTSAIDEFSSSEKRRVRRLAAKLDNNWNKLQDVLNVHYDYESGEFIYGVDGSEEDKQLAAVMEYGTPDTPPSSLLRSSALYAGQTIHKDLNDIVASHIERNA